MSAAAIRDAFTALPHGEVLAWVDGDPDNATSMGLMYLPQDSAAAFAAAVSVPPGALVLVAESAGYIRCYDVDGAFPLYVASDQATAAVSTELRGTAP